MTRGATTVAVAEVIDPDKLLAPPEFEGFHDPHVWFDVASGWKRLTAVQDALTEMDPDHADDYAANAQAYLAELEALDAYVAEQAARVPEEQRVLITAHDAFNYFGRAYGFEVRGLQGISTATEAGTADVQDLARFIAERQIPAIFVESSCRRAPSRRCRPPSAPRASRCRSAASSSPTPWATPGHARGHLRRHGAPQRRHHRQRASRGHD